MHIIIGTLIAIATLVYWLGMASRGAREVVDVAQEVANLPRKMRYRKKAGQQGLDLIESPVEAAAVLMLSIAKMDGKGTVSETQEAAIAKQLVQHMQLQPVDAKDMVLQLQSITAHIMQPDSPLFKMIKLLQKDISREEAHDLVDMMQVIASYDDPVNSEQSSFILRFKERMGLLH